MRLSDARVRNLKVKAGATERLVADGNGLYLRLRLAGGEASRTWLYRRKVAGRLTVVRLGAYPVLSIKDARLRTAELALQASVESPTVAEAAERWFTEHVEPRCKRSDLMRLHLDGVVLPTLGTRRVCDVRPVDIANLVRSHRDRVGRSRRGRAGGLPAARALLAVLKGLFRHATASGWIDASPATQVTASLIGPAPVARDRVLTDDEIRAVLALPDRAGPLLRFLLVTGLRIGEAFQGHRDGQWWIVPAAVAKNSREHRVWLAPLALAQLAHSWEIARATLQHGLRQSGAGWTAHDLRRTFATRLNGMGVAPHIVERALNHTLGGVAGVYNRSEYETERRDALDNWSAWLERLAQPEPVAGVIVLHSRAA